MKIKTSVIFLLPLCFVANFSNAKCELEKSCAISITTPVDEKYSPPILHANEGMELGAESGIKNKRNEPGSVALMNSSLQILGEVSVGQIYAADNVDSQYLLPKTSKIYTSEYKVKGKRAESARYSYPDISLHETFWKVKFVKEDKIDTTIKGKKLLEPKRYGKITLSKDAEWVLKAGTYYVDEISALPSSKMVLDNEKGTVIVYVRQKLQLPHRIVSLFSPSDILFVYLGEEPVEVATALDASIIAPEAKLVFLPQVKDKVAVHQGVFYANELSLGERNEVIEQRISRKGPAFADLLASIEKAPSPDQAMESYSSQVVEPFSDSPMGQLLRSHVQSMFGYGPNAEAEYQASLEKLRENPEEALSELVDEYEEVPETFETQQIRWSLVQIMSELKSELAIDTLNSIALSQIKDVTPANYYEEDPTHPTDFQNKEHMIRARAMDGLAALSQSGSKIAEQTLLENVSKTEGLSQRYAVQGYLGENRTAEKISQLKSILPEQDHHLLDLNTDASSVNLDVEPIEATEASEHRHAPTQTFSNSDNGQSSAHIIINDNVNPR